MRLGEEGSFEVDVDVVAVLGVGVEPDIGVEEKRPPSEPRRAFWNSDGMVGIRVRGYGGCLMLGAWVSAGLGTAQLACFDGIDRLSDLTAWTGQAMEEG